MKKRFSIRNRFIAMGSIILITLVGVNLFMLVMIDRFATLPLQIIDHPLQVSNAASYANIEVMRMQKDLEQIVLVEKDFEVNILVDRIRVSEGEVYVALDIIAYDILGDEGKVLQREARDLFDSWKPIRSQIIEAVRSEKRDEAVSIIRVQGTEHAEIMERKLVELNRYARTKATEFQNDVIKLEDELRSTVVIGMVLAVVVTAASITWIGINVLKSINSLSGQLNEIIDSNVPKKVYLEGDDELVELSGIFNNLVMSLDEQLWVREGNRRLYSSLSGNDDFMSVMNRYVSEIASYCGLVSVAYYHMSNDDLDLVGVVNRMKFMDTKVHAGQGIVGECVTIKRPNYIDYDNYRHNSNGDLPYSGILVEPVFNTNQIYGVLMIVTKSDLALRVREYINVGLKDLIAYLSNYEQRKRNNTLLEQYIQTNEELKIRQNELEDANAYRSQFFANVSHELKTPLNSIIILSKLLKDKTLQNDRNEDNEKIKVINKAANELLRTIDDILDLARVESGKVELDENLFTINQLVDKVETIYKPLVLEKGLDVSFEFKESPTLYGDMDKIYHIISNLMSNAIKFTKTGRVSLEVKINENSLYPVVISVEDTGIGIRKEKFETIFEEFVQSDGSIIRHYGGTGLGLAICKNYTNLLGGKLEVQSEVGYGSTFSLLLPREILNNSGHELGKRFVVTNEEKVAVELRSDLKDKKIIICDDEPYNVFALSSMLEGLGLIALEAMSALEMDKIYRSQKVDLILVDYMMPEVDGISAMTTLEESDYWTSTPVVIITAAELDQENLGVIEKHNYALMKKPIDPNELIRLINEKL